MAVFDSTLLDFLSNISLPDTDHLAEDYSRRASMKGVTPQGQEAAMLLAAAEGWIVEEDPEEAIVGAFGALYLLREVGDVEGEADALRLIAHGQRRKAKILRKSQQEADAAAAQTLLKAEMRNVQNLASQAQARGSPRSEAAMLLSFAELSFEALCGPAHWQQHHLEQALRAATRARALLLEADDQRLEGRAALVVGHLKLASGLAVDEVVEVANEAEALLRDEGDAQGQALCLDLVSHAKSKSGEAKQAAEAAARAASLYSQQTALGAEALAAALYRLAVRQLRHGRPQLAVEAAEKGRLAVQQTAVAVSSTRLLAVAFGAVIAEAKVNRATPEEAIDLAEELLAGCRGEGREQLLALQTLALVHASCGDLEKALSVSQESLELCRSLGEHEWEADLMLAAATIQGQAGDGHKAAAFASGAARIFKRLANRRGEAAARLAEGQAHLANGDPYDALQAAGEAQALSQKLGGGQLRLEADALLVIAGAHHARGDSKEADQAAWDAYSLFSKQGEVGKGGAVSSLLLAAEAQQARGELNAALQSAGRVQGLLREAKDELAEAGTLRFMAGVLMEQQRYGDAARTAAEAQKIGKRAQESDLQQADTLLLVAQAGFAQLRADELKARDKRRVLEKGRPRVMRASEEALRMARSAGEKLLLAQALYVHGAVCRYFFFHLEKTGQLEEVVATANEAAKLFYEAGDKAGQAGAVVLAAEVHAVLGHVEKGFLTASEALDLASACGEEEVVDRANYLLQQFQQPQMMQMQQLPALQPAANPAQSLEMPAADVPPATTIDVAQSIAQVVKSGFDRDYVKQLVVETASEAIGQDESLDMDKALMEVGLDSLGAITFRNKLQSELGFKLPGTLMFDFPTMGAVVDFLVEESQNK